MKQPWDWPSEEHDLLFLQEKAGSPCITMKLQKISQLRTFSLADRDSQQLYTEPKQIQVSFLANKRPAY